MCARLGRGKGSSGAGRWPGAGARLPCAPVPTRPSDFALLARLFRYGLRYRGRLVLMLLATAAVGASTGYLFKALKDVLALLQEADGGGQTGIDGLRWLAVQLALLAPWVAGAAYLAWTQGQWLANRCMLDLRGEFLSHLVRLELGFHNGLTRGDLISRMTNDLAWVQGLFQSVFGKVLQRPAATVGISVWLFWINWRMAAAIFLILVPVGFVLSRLLRRTRKRSRRARASLGENVSVLEQITAGIRVIKAMGSAEAESARYARANEELFAANMRVARARAQTDAVTNGAIYLLTGIALVACAWLVGRSEITVPDLIAFLAALGSMTSNLRSGNRSWGEIQECLPAAERVLEVLDRPSQIVDKPDALPCPPPRQAIRLEGVHFAYGEGADVLPGVDLTIPIGTTVALVGESGGGKSTVMNLIPRFYDVTGGKVTIDGVDVRDLRHADLVHHFAIVQQDSFLFNDTVAANIRYGRPGATEAEIEQAARRAHVHEAILALEGGAGYQTVVGDRGERLSGGQRQRVAIARALLRDAPVLLLDEPTSALDSESESHIQAALRELMRGRTSIMIAHRLATIQHADVIYVLGKGAGVIEAGSHHELIAKDGTYARLVRMQELK